MIAFVIHVALSVILWLIVHLGRRCCRWRFSPYWRKSFSAASTNGDGGVAAEFVVRVLLLPFQMAQWLIRGLWREWRRSRYRHVRIKGPRRHWASAWLNRAAQRIATRHPRRAGGPLLANDDPRSDFEARRHAHLRVLRRRGEGDLAPWRVAKVGPLRHPGTDMSLPSAQDASPIESDSATGGPPHRASLNILQDPLMAR